MLKYYQNFLRLWDLAIFFFLRKVAETQRLKVLKKIGSLVLFRDSNKT
jgi:hypothetical protein